MRSLLLLALVLLPVVAPAQVLRTLTAPDSLGTVFGKTVAAVGDLDGDGTDDLAIGSSYRSGESPQGAGRVYLFSGGSGAVLRTLASPNEEQGGAFGGGVALAGDLNGDGVPDVLVGATSEDRPSRPNGGRAYAFSGATGALLYELGVPDTPRTGNLIGYALAGLGDVTGDGIPDLAVGDPGGVVASPAGDLYGAGRVYVLSGADGEVVRTLQSPAPVGPNDFGGIGGQFGLHVATVGDATGDGVSDLVVYALADDLRGGCETCQAWTLYLYSGAVGAPVWTARRPVVTPSDPDSGLGFGTYLSVVGDVDADGAKDLVVGSNASDAAPGPMWGDGAAFVISGRTGAILHVLVSPEPGAFGSVVGAAGDADGDGTPDVAVLDGLPTPRRVRVFSGATGAALNTYVTTSTQANGGGFGGAVTTLGDLDGDGKADLVVGAALEDVDGVTNAGRVYIYSGMPVAGEDAPRSAPALAATVTPNPARSSATLALRLAEAASVRVAVVDALGRVVRRLGAGALAPGAHRIALGVDGLAPGVYVVRVTAGDGAASARLVVAR